MSFSQNQTRELTEEEVKFWEEIAEQAIARSAHWQDYLEKEHSLKNAIKSRILPLSLAAELAEDLRKMAN